MNHSSARNSEENFSANLPLLARSTKRRVRLTIIEKRKVLETFYLSSHSSVSSFVKQYNHNKTLSFITKLDASSVSKWIQAEGRGEYLRWNQTPSLSNVERKICHTTLIADTINMLLEERDIRCAQFNLLTLSILKPSHYGVIAREYILAGTFLGFYKGDCVYGEQVQTKSYENLFCVNNCQFIDAHNFYSCYARYYQCTSDKDLQNVCVKRILNAKDPQKTICFITTKDVEAGDELLIPNGCEYWVPQTNTVTAEPSVAFRKILSKLLLKVPRFSVQPTSDSLFSDLKVQELANWFGDNHAFPRFADNNVDSSDEDEQW